MNKKQALDLLAQVCAQYKGSLQEHTAIQQALKIVSTEEIEPVTNITNEKEDIRIPIAIANFNGRSEKASMISDASLILFFKV